MPGGCRAIEEYSIQTSVGEQEAPGAEAEPGLVLNTIAMNAELATRVDEILSDVPLLVVGTWILDLQPDVIVALDRVTDHAKLCSLWEYIDYVRVGRRALAEIDRGIRDDRIALFERTDVACAGIPALIATFVAGGVPARVTLARRTVVG